MDDNNIKNELSRMNLPLEFGKKKRSTLHSHHHHSNHHRNHQDSSSISNPPISSSQPPTNSSNFDSSTNSSNPASSLPPSIINTFDSNFDSFYARVPVASDRKLYHQIGPSVPTISTPPPFPTTQQFLFGHHRKEITCISIDSTGNRIYTGSSDCSVMYWNLSGMTPRGDHSETSIEEVSADEINDIDVSPNTKLILVSSGTPEVRLYGPTGLKIGETKRGDMYLYDMQHTVGHVSSVTGGKFKPEPTASTFATSSSDGTLRIWDVKHLERHRTLFRLSESGSPRNPAKSLAWGEGDSLYVATSLPGARCYDERGPTDSPSLEFASDTPFDFLTSSESLLAGRSWEFRKVIVWDTRKPESTLLKIPTASQARGISFSPDNKWVLVPEKVHKQELRGGSLGLFSVDGGVEETRVGFAAGIGVNVAQWAQRTNEIVCGCTDGFVRVLFDVRSSKGGAITALEKGLSIKEESDEMVVGSLIPRVVDPETERIIRGFWFPFRGDDVRDKRAAMEPKAPIWGEGHHGMIGVHPVQAELAELRQVDVPEDTDIVESLRKHSEMAKVGYFTKVREFDKRDED